MKIPKGLFFKRITFSYGAVDASFEMQRALISQSEKCLMESEIPFFCQRKCFVGSKKYPM